MKLQDLYNKLDKLKASGKIVEWRANDRGNVVVINIGYQTEEDVVEYRNFVVRVYNRGTAKEEVKWEITKPPFFESKSPFIQHAESKRQEIVNKLRTEYNVVKVIGYTIDEIRQYVIVSGFVDNGDGSVSQKSFIIFFDETGRYTIYELRPQQGMTYM